MNIKNTCLAMAALFLCSAFFISHSKTVKINAAFNVVVSAATGDLNKDGLADSVVVLQDTIPDPSPYQLKVFLKKPQSGYQLVVTSNTAIESRYLFSGSSFDTAKIFNNVLTLEYELLRGHYEHKFRYQQGNFELIGYSYSGSDGIGTMNSIDFNLSTGRYMEVNENYETGKVISKKDTLIRIRPLPKLQHFTPFEHDYF